MNLEADLCVQLAIEDIAAVEYEGWAMHLAIDLADVESLELIPLGHDGDRMRLISGSITVRGNEHIFVDQFLIGWMDMSAWISELLDEVFTNLCFADSWIVDEQASVFAE